MPYTGTRQVYLFAMRYRLIKKLIVVLVTANIVSVTEAVPIMKSGVITIAKAIFTI